LKKKINRPVPELPLSEDTDVLDLNSMAGGNGHSRQGNMPLKDHQQPQRHGRPFPTRRAHLPELWPRCRAQRRLLQVPELRREPGLLIRGNARDRPGSFLLGLFFSSPSVKLRS